MLDFFSMPVEALWLAVALVAIMAGMLAAARRSSVTRTGSGTQWPGWGDRVSASSG
jgi:hypothetical protein